MGRQQSSVLKLLENDQYGWGFVVQWLARRFDEEELNWNSSVMSQPVAEAVDRNEDTRRVHESVRLSWRGLQKRWASGWEKDYDRKLEDADGYFETLIAETDAWINQMFPSNSPGPDRERKRLLAAVRQHRLREKRKERASAIQVSVSGDLFKQLRQHWLIPDSKRHDVVRAALKIVLDAPDLLAKAKLLAGVPGSNAH